MLKGQVLGRPAQITARDDVSSYLLFSERLPRDVYDVLEQPDDGEDAADDRADLGEEGGEGLALLLHHHLRTRARAVARGSEKRWRRKA